MSVSAAPLRAERYLSSSSVEPDELWALVGDPRRLPEWSDVTEIVAPDDVAEGAEISLRVGESWNTWRVLTLANYGWEATTTLPAGELALGCRVASEIGSDRVRLVLVAVLQPSGGRLRARLLTMPRIAARLERWARAGIDGAQQ